jgi:gluconolactonase
MRDTAGGLAYIGAVKSTFKLLPLGLACLAVPFPSFAAEAATPAIVSATAPYPAIGSVERLDSALDALLAPGVNMEKLAEGFSWSEGPVWLPREQRLFFSDVPRNTAYQWKEGAGATVFLQPSGYTGLVPGPNAGEGSNGLTLDRDGRLLLCQHGDRRISRLNDDGKTFTTLVDRFEGKRFSSPNDLCVDRHGNIYFTDPPYGLGKVGVQEIEFSGIYRRAPDGTVTLLNRELERPNGIALSPDEKTLYVDNTDEKRPVILAIPLQADGTAGASRVFFDTTALRVPGRPGSLDGMKVDVHGNVWATGPGGILIISAGGRHLGTLLTGRSTANCCFGGPDGSTFYITAQNTLCRIQTKTKGNGL